MCHAIADEARHLFHSAYGLQDLTVAGDKSEFFAETNHKPLTDISLTYCAFGGSAELGFPSTSYARQLFRYSGEMVVKAGNATHYVPVDHSMPTPIGQPATFRYAGPPAAHPPDRQSGPDQEADGIARGASRTRPWK